MKIICGACSKPLSIDESKLPEKEVSFPCPLCKTKLRVDKRTIDPSSEKPHTAAVANGDATAPQPAQTAAAPAAATPATPAPGTGPVDQSASGEGKPALVVGENSAEVQQAVRALGYSPVHRASAEEGRDYFLQEFPEIVLFVPQAVAQPPMEDLVPLTSVGPAERRQGFFIMVGDNLRSLDGNAAFLYGMNLVVAKKDLGSIERIYADARKDHDRLTRAFKLFEEE
ncbi:MAG: hypothetical protein R3338_07515 [Thermoanaerobaculia bacterium]|nr:hypothetical protein [Thermoanaerobaculia bacterium]